MNVSLVYNNKKLIGKCSKFAIEKVQGTSPFVMLENFEPKQPQLNENQKALVIWMQENECYNGDPLESISDLFLEGTPSEHFPDLPLSCVEAAYQSLNNQQKIEMVQKYLEQYLEQGEE
ncbi:hypothetical protein [Enterococcus saccharolyticus]|uniref:hypothetical protein n=1 Tax=Enterococcus saccharolyticus TaxID=41997 RepID=UPI00104198C8|nr:hypothetical protein [Enterococcus saccharolyticus]